MKRRILPLKVGEKPQPKRRALGHSGCQGDAPFRRQHQVTPPVNLSTAVQTGKTDGLAVVDLTCAGSSPRGDERKDDDDFCVIVTDACTSGPAEANTARVRAPAKPAHPVWDLASDTTTEDSSSGPLEMVQPDKALHATAAAAAGAAALRRAQTAAAAPVCGMNSPLQIDLLADQDSAADFGAAGAGPISACPSCRATDQDAVRRHRMSAAERQLCAETTVALLSPGSAAGAAAAAASDESAQCCTSCRRMAALAVVEAAQRQVCDIVRVHSKSGLAIRGWVFEVHHAASYNIAALRAGSPLRAERLEHKGADIRVYNVADPRVTLAQAQLKASGKSEYLRKLNNPKYKESIKVVPRGLDADQSGRSSVLSYGGVSSSPISLSELEDAVRVPGDHFFGLMWS